MEVLEDHIERKFENCGREFEERLLRMINEHKVTKR